MRFEVLIFSTILLYIICFLQSCNTENNNNDNISLSSFNLEKYGISAIVKIPKDATITEDPQAREKALVITAPQFNIRVEVYQLDSAESASSWLYDNIENEKLEGDFSKIVEEDSLGFVFERSDKEDGISYHFRHIVQKANKLIIFSEGIPQKNNFDLHSILQMYNAVKQ